MRYIPFETSEVRPVFAQIESSPDIDETSDDNRCRADKSECVPKPGVRDIQDSCSRTQECIVKEKEQDHRTCFHDTFLLFFNRASFLELNEIDQHGNKDQKGAAHDDEDTGELQELSLCC